MKNNLKRNLEGNEILQMVSGLKPLFLQLNPHIRRIITTGRKTLQIHRKAGIVNEDKRITPKKGINPNNCSILLKRLKLFV